MNGDWSHRIVVPGRVNLIGEHIDYAGLSVLPMAIDRRLTLDLRPRSDGLVRIVNAQVELGERGVRLSDPGVALPAGDWGNYVRAAAIGLAEAGLPAGGFDGRLTTDLPPAAGLSSSSALVVASALGMMVAAETELPDALTLAAILARAEGHTGTRGGGMDQAAILAGRRGMAVRIDFDPLAATPIPIPDGWSFIVGHSLEQAEKSGTVQATYNARRGEVENALRVAVAAIPGTPNDATYAELLEEHSAAELTRDAAEFDAPLGSRFRHVVSEADRVRAATECLRSNDVAGFGRLMLASHASLCDEFEVSTASLDALVGEACEGGALGARLTGAGLGGCVVVLVRTVDAPVVMRHLAGTFYASRGVVPTRDHLFLASPAGGARVESSARGPTVC